MRNTDQGEHRLRQWYAAQVLPYLERTTEHHLWKMGFGFFIPVIRQKRIKKGVEADHCVRLFPGYLFVEFDSREDLWEPINNVPGVVKLLPSGLERPIPLTDGFVSELKDGIESGVFTAIDAEKVVRKYVKDELVVVTGGPFEYLSGRVIRYEKGALILLMYLFNRPTEVPVPLHLVTA